MLCEKCNSINWDELCTAPGYKHHKSLEDLRASADDGCKLCKLVWRKRAFVDLNRRTRSERSPQEQIHGQIYCSSYTDFLGPADEDPGISTVIFQQSSTQSKKSLKVSFGIFTQTGDPFAATGMISGRPIAQFIDSEACLELARGWIQTCLEGHAACPNTVSAPLPTRVLDVGPRDGTCEPLLLETHGQSGQWVALSHRWSDNTFKATKENLESLRQVVPLNEISSTYQNAIRLTRSLGYRYIWIDSICIIQDSPEDWAMESSQMHYIYTKSVLTIAADSEGGDDEGFFINRPRESPFTPVEVPISSLFRGLRGTMYFRDITDHHPQGILDSRAWILQEEVLSPRTLRYCNNRMIWECQELLLFEEDTAPFEDDGVIHENVKRYFLAPDERLRQKSSKLDQYYKFYDMKYRWTNIINNYAKREITFHEDRLPALSGLGKEVQKQTNYTYIAGLWLEHIHRGLLWAIEGCGLTPPTYIAPSWSWASLIINQDINSATGGHWYQDLDWEVTDPAYDAEIIDYNIEYHENTPFGRVRSGHLTIRGRWHSADFAHDYPPPYVNRFDKPRVLLENEWRSLSDSEEVAELNQIICDFDRSEIDEESGEVTTPDESLPSRCYLQIAKWLIEDTGGKGVIYALILEPTGNAGNEYRRIGRAKIPESIADKDYEMKTIRII